MNWTNEKPTKPGWYWWNGSAWGNIVIHIQLLDNAGIGWFPPGDYIFRSAPDGQFAGPIPEPTECTRLVVDTGDGKHIPIKPITNFTHPKNLDTSE